MSSVAVPSPPLGWWRRRLAEARPRWKHHLVTALLMLLYGGLGCASLTSTIYQEHPHLTGLTGRAVGRYLLDLLAGMVAVLTLPWLRGRRRRAAGIAAVVAVLISGATGWSLLVAVHALIVASTWRSWRWIAAVDAAMMVAAWLSAIASHEQWRPIYFPVFAVLLAAFNLWGLYRGSRRALVESYRQQAEAARREEEATRREQEAVVARVRAEERATIAREMHDTLSHRLAVISLFSGGLATRSGLAEHTVTETAELLQNTARTASEELRDLLSVLREDHGDRLLPISLADLDTIVDEVRALGTPVDLVLTPEGLRDELGRLAPQRSTALAHAVREGLANAIKHAPGAPVWVGLSADDMGITAQVVNPLRERGLALAGGHGLVGLAERLRLADGHLVHREQDGNHRLEAWVPWT